ncbi:hypothetical protein KEM52_000488 [Ascosphaera acerosa]|nr:hypothetical protein KEM52_000488 [Ascosphaera acerosa]
MLARQSPSGGAGPGSGPASAPTPAHARARAAAVPSRGALRALRKLALSNAAAATTVGTIGGLCTLALVSYDIHRKTKIAEQIIEHKNQLQAACPEYRARDPVRRKYASVVNVDRLPQALRETAGEGGREGGSERDSAPVPATMTADAGAQAGLRSPGTRTPQPAAASAIQPSSRSSSTAAVAGPAGAGSASGSTPSDTESPPPPTSQLPASRQSNNTPSVTSRGSSFAPRETTIQSIARARLAQFSLRYAQTNEQICLHARIHALLREGKLIEATQHFLDLYAASPDFSRESRREAAVTLLYANLRDDNVSLASSVFETIEDQGFGMTPALWELMLLAYGKDARPDAIADLYLKYAHQYRLPKNLSVMVVRALLDTYRVDEAREFAHHFLYRDDDCAIAGLYLQGVWKTSRKVELVESQFQQLVKMFSRRRKQVAEKLFEPMLKAYIEAGHEERAVALIRAMKNDFGVAPGLRTMGLIAYSKALQCDWDAVEADVKAIHASGVAALHPHKFAKIFHRILLEYAIANSGKKTYDFILLGLNDCNIKPDQVLFDHITSVLIERGGADQVDKIIRMSQQRKWPVAVDKEQLLERVRAARLAIEMTGHSLWDMYQAHAQQRGYTALSSRVLGHDIASIPLHEAYQLPWTHQPSKWWANAMQLRDPKKPLNQFLPLYAQMLHFIQAGKPKQALLLFRLAKEAGFVMKRMHIELAVTASIAEEEDLYGAQEILDQELAHRAQGFGHAAGSHSGYLHQVMSAKPSMLERTEALVMAVHGFYRLLERKLLPFQHSFMANISSRLIKRGNSQAALSLVHAICNSRYGGMVPFDDNTVRILIRGFASAGNLRGVRWAIVTAIHRPELLTRPLLIDVLRVLETLRLTQPGTDAAVTPEQYQEYLAHLAWLAEILSAKYEAQLPRHWRESLQRREPIEASMDGTLQSDQLATLMSSLRSRSSPASHTPDGAPPSPPATPTDEAAATIGHKPSRIMQSPVVSIDDIARDTQDFDATVAGWKEMAQLDLCLGGQSDSHTETLPLGGDLRHRADLHGV